MTVPVSGFVQSELILSGATTSSMPRTHDGRLLRILALIDEYTRECLALRVARRLNSQNVIETLPEVMLWRGIPKPIRSGNGPEFVARQLRDWLQGLGTSPLYIESGSPW